MESSLHPSTLDPAAPRGPLGGDRPTLITPRLLRRWPLPRPDAAGDKETRGQVLIVGGAPAMPGAAILAATAALRAGAGKLQIATGASIAPLVAAAVPESYVHALPETASGAIDPAAAGQLAESAGKASAVVLGPGLVDAETAARLVADLIPRLDGPALVIDAAAFAGLSADHALLRRHPLPAVLTPHATEMALLLGLERRAVTAEPAATAGRAAGELGAVVALKGADTFVAAPDGPLYHDRGGNVGLATSGSGDALSGLIAGLLARGATPLQATAWGVHVHGRAGERLARRVGPLGFLARELLAEIPPLIHALSTGPTARRLRR